MNAEIYFRNIEKTKNLKQNWKYYTHHPKIEFDTTFII